MAISTSSLVHAILQGQLLPPEQLNHLTGHLQPRFADPRALGRELLDRSWLTPFQLNQLLQGRGNDLAVGPYVLLERLGEGGTGQVFKARHRDQRQIVALKVIRKDYATDAETIKRFHREMKLTSQLAHPNVVRSIDASSLGGTHLMVMEYLEGVDLGRLVEQSGPLPISQACDYIRQSALGLQHIHEHGLIHRDIKPSNLLLTRSQTTGGETGSIKILDLGLARLQGGAQGKGNDHFTDGQSITSLSLDGAGTMGTIDYLSPEQARDFHRVDIRGDLYSLGCTFVYLLTGKPPFGNGSLLEKMMYHQNAEPPNVRKVRAELPEELSLLIRRLMAKRPEDRYQTPGEVAKALAPYCTQTRAKKRTTPIALFVGLSVSLLFLGLMIPLLWLFTRSAPAKPNEPSEKPGLVDQESPKLKQNPVPPPKPGELAVTITKVSTDKLYEVVPARVGERLYIDRAYTITLLSPGLVGGKLIRSSNVDKLVSKDEHLTFTLNLPSVVYVAYDSRGRVLPAWLSDGTWQLTREAFRSADGSGNLSRNVYRKEFPAGNITLGGPMQKPAQGGSTHYVVIIQPLKEQP